MPLRSCVQCASRHAISQADDFDNHRSPEQYRRSHENSHAVVFGSHRGRYVANGRILSDGVCNAYLLDVWTMSAYRRQGIGAAMVRQLMARAPGQHIGLQTDDAQGFYSRLGFRPQPEFLSLVVGEWLDNDANRG